jgi:hypothetical protein
MSPGFDHLPDLDPDLDLDRLPDFVVRLTP